MMQRGRRLFQFSYYSYSFLRGKSNPSCSSSLIRTPFRFLSSNNPVDVDTSASSSSFIHHQHTTTDTSGGFNYQQQQARLLQASLNHVIRLGWTEAAMIAAARDLALSPSIVGSISSSSSSSPSAAAALVEYFMDQCLQNLIHIIQDSGDLQDLPPSHRISNLIKLRLQMQAPYISNWPQALSIQAQPSNISTSFKQRAMLVDEFLNASYNEQPTAPDWYLKRTIVAGIYSTTELYMLTDNSTDFEDTWIFLNERVRDAFDLEKTFQEVKYFAEAVGAGFQGFKNKGGY
ncbi:hypothetical protein QVD17_29557 [Tagetes erecta]|uniref:Ubiquinone biosynthesis protein n=1 Tax=Tagetes erecta TaxID=13708 RepID=A0AAD8NMI4_TARER|nr:hypothetical protein QVD17_29557 [Tagetes erecta]